MSLGSFGAGRFDRGTTDGDLHKAYIVACLVAGAAVSAGGIAAIAAVAAGATAAASLTVLSAFVLAGLVAAVAVVRLARPRTRPSRRAARRSLSREDRRAMRRDRKALRRSPDCSPAAMLEEQLATRYGVPVERVASHVWRIGGELVEATLDPVSGRLMTGNRELQL